MARARHGNDETEAEAEAEAAGLDDARARAFWSGTISFGLVSVPVQLFPATRDTSVSLRMLAPDGTPLERRWHCPKDDKDVPWDELVRGFEEEDGSFVVMTDDELAAAAPEKSRDIDLRRFVPADELDPIYFERGYFLAPDGASTKAYRLLAAAMEKSGLAGIATFVMRTREYWIAILSEDGILRGETLRWPDELRAPADVGLAEPPEPAPAALRKVDRAITELTARSLAEKELEDGGTKRLLKLVKAKLKKGEDVIEAPADADATPTGAGIIDLMEVLKRSLAGNAAKRPAEPGRRAPRTSPRKPAKPSTRKSTPRKAG